MNPRTLAREFIESLPSSKDLLERLPLVPEPDMPTQDEIEEFIALIHPGWWQNALTYSPPVFFKAIKEYLPEKTIQFLPDYHHIDDLNISSTAKIQLYYTLARNIGIPKFEGRFGINNYKKCGEILWSLTANHFKIPNNKNLNWPRDLEKPPESILEKVILFYSSYYSRRPEEVISSLFLQQEYEFPVDINLWSIIPGAWFDPIIIDGLDVFGPFNHPTLKNLLNYCFPTIDDGSCCYL
jgi:hypothetical protein